MHRNRQKRCVYSFSVEATRGHCRLVCSHERLVKVGGRLASALSRTTCRSQQLKYETDIRYGHHLPRLVLSILQDVINEWRVEAPQKLSFVPHRDDK